MTSERKNDITFDGVMYAWGHEEGFIATLCPTLSHDWSLCV